VDTRVSVVFPLVWLLHGGLVNLVVIRIVRQFNYHQSHLHLFQTHFVPHGCSFLGGLFFVSKDGVRVGKLVIGVVFKELNNLLQFRSSECDDFFGVHALSSCVVKGLDATPERCQLNSMSFST
jgi:hypothetical protein